jgi:DNA topoisomerase-1
MSKMSSGKKLVIVESPTKAKTIRKFLGKEFIVESCMGHVRDLPQSARDIPEKYKKFEWANIGVNTDKGFEPIYLVPKTKTKIVNDLKKKVSEASEVILATDEDREGESISWHLVELLQPKVPVRRIVFNEITKEAINAALSEFRKIDMNLVQAQEARRVLDRLVGYSLSPLLWKKIAYGLSAGRVQSAAVRLVAEREYARLKFKKASYWDIIAKHDNKKIEFESRLLEVQGKKVATGKDFDPDTGEIIKDKAKDFIALTEAQCKKIYQQIQNKDFIVASVEEKPLSRKPAAPFITSTLQQEANRKLGLSARETMQVAQKLYEKGLITYMRTDSTFLSEQAIKASRDYILKEYGKAYLPKEPRDYAKKKVKGAQEAHEAIRPAGTDFIAPDASDLSGFELKLYDLIFKRTLASQMMNSEHKQMSVRFEVENAVFLATGMTTEFPGYLKAYVESNDEDDAGPNKALPLLKKGEAVKVSSAKMESHETKPPARFTEASLVQALEKLGIGRPSTYAAIITTIQDRGYVLKSGNALVPTFTALAVNKLLEQYFPQFVDYEFTSGMERSLDDIAAGEMDSKKYLSSIYLGPNGLQKQIEKQDKQIDADEARTVPLLGLDGFTFRIGRFGAYVCRQEGEKEICASVPDNQFPGEMTKEAATKIIDLKLQGNDALGKDPETGLSIYVLAGRYGPYVQLGENSDNNGKPKRMALPAALKIEDVKIEQALFLLSLPRSLGKHPDTKKDIKLGIGRFGPYVVHDGDYRSVPKAENFFGVNLKRALELFAQPKKSRGRGAQALKDLGKHPDTGDPIQVLSGKYGPYVNCGKVNVSLPEASPPEELSLKAALELLSTKMKPKKNQSKPMKSQRKTP